MAETATAPKSPEKLAKRKQQRAKIAAANRITVILETPVRKSLTRQAHAAGMKIAPFVQKLVDSHIIAELPEGDVLGDRLRAKRAVFDHAVDLARKIDSDGGFDQHFILTVMKKASENPEFKANYETATGAGAKQPARHLRTALNQQLARLIKRAVSARSKRDDKHKIMRAQAKGEILTSYTLLDKAA